MAEKNIKKCSILSVLPVFSESVHWVPWLPEHRCRKQEEIVQEKEFVYENSSSEIQKNSSSSPLLQNQITES